MEEKEAAAAAAVDDDDDDDDVNDRVYLRTFMKPSKYKHLEIPQIVYDTTFKLPRHQPKCLEFYCHKMKILDAVISWVSSDTFPKTDNLMPRLHPWKQKNNEVLNCLKNFHI